MVCDFQSDTSRRILFSLFDTVPLPDYVKSAETSQFSPEKLASLPPQAFADPKHRMFPCHTKTATLLSSLYYSRCRTELPKSEVKRMDTYFAKVAQFFNIQNDMEIAVRAITKNEVDRIKSASREDFALIINNDDGTTDCLYPINDVDNLKAAAASLQKHANHFPYEWRKSAAQAMLRKAAEFKVDLGSYIWNAAGIEPVAIEDAIVNLTKRADLIDRRQTEIVSNFLKAAERLSKLGKVDFTAELATKMANLVDAIDREVGISDRYGEVPMPEQMFFCERRRLIKLAKELIVQTTAGDVFYKEDLRKAGIAPFVALGADIADEVAPDGMTFDLEKAAEVLRTLPLDDARRFATFMQQCGHTKSAFWDSKNKRSVGRFTKKDWSDMFSEAGFNVEDEDYTLAIKPKRAPLAR